MTKDKLDFWNERASLSDTAGSNDFIGKNFEMDAISKFIKDGMNILDIGCGSGTLAFFLASNFDVDITGCDFSPRMIEQAELDMTKLGFDKKKMRFHVEDVTKILNSSTLENSKFDIVITERVIINLDSWEEQKKAIQDIMNFVKPNGSYLMCENLQDGLDNLNILRNKMNLETIKQPWHNRYLVESEVDEINNVTIADKIDFSSTYYFFSRIINAAVAEKSGNNPEYDSPINKVSFEIKDYIDLSSLNIGQSRLWVIKNT